MMILDSQHALYHKIARTCIADPVTHLYVCLQATRLYATNHMRVLLRARVLFFHSWGIELLVTQVKRREKNAMLLSCGF